MSVIGTGTEYLNYTAAVPSKTNELTVLVWGRRDSGASDGLGGISDGFANRALFATQTGTSVIRIRRFDNASLETTTTLSAGTFYAIAIRWTPETTINSSADARVDAWVWTEGNVGSGADETVNTTGITTGTTEADGLVALADTTDGDNPFVGVVAMLKVWERHLTVAQMETELQYRNPQITDSLFASYAFRTGALTTDDSVNGRTLTNNNAAAFSSAEPSDLLGDDPAGGPTGIVVTATNDIQG